MDNQDIPVEYAEKDMKIKFFDDRFKEWVTGTITHINCYSCAPGCSTRVVNIKGDDGYTYSGIETLALYKINP